jgi:hypothetical protein
MGMTDQPISVKNIEAFINSRFLTLEGRDDLRRRLLGINLLISTGKEFQKRYEAAKDNPRLRTYYKLQLDELRNRYDFITRQIHGFEATFDIDFRVSAAPISGRIENQLGEPQYYPFLAGWLLNTFLEKTQKEFVLCTW